MGYELCVYCSYGHLQFLVLAFVDVLSKTRTNIVGQSYGNRRISARFKWKSNGARAMSVRSPYNFWLSPCGLPYDRRTIFCPQISIKIRVVTARSSQSLHTAPARHVYGLQSYDFLEIVKVQTNTKS